MGALDTVKSLLTPRRGRHRAAEVSRFDMSWYLQMLSQSQIGGGYAPSVPTTYGKSPAEPIGNSFTDYVTGGLQSNGIIFALELKRLQVFSQARFQFQRLRGGRPGELWGNDTLGLLEEPWTGGTTGDLLARMILDADFAGNNFQVELDGELVRLRPDWVEIVLAPRTGDYGQDGESVTVGYKQLGILYYEGGIQGGVKPAIFLRGEYSHFAPIPDPLATYRGMSWLTPVIREIQADTQATKHKLKFFENAATPNLAVKLPKELSPAQFREFVDLMDESHKGTDNAYKTLYTAGGADVTVVGADMHQLDFKVTQGAGETRLAAAAGVHPVIAGLSEGMQGSSLNAGNYTSAKRSFVDTTCRHLWQNVAGSLQVLVPAPGGSRLWYDARDIPFLAEDSKDRADILSTHAGTINTLKMAGYTSDSIIAAVTSEDLTLLVDTGLLSVQLQPPGTGVPTDGGGAGPKAPAARSIARKFNPAQVRDPHTGKWIDTHPGDGGHGALDALGDALGGQDALDATPAKLTRPPDGHHGNYDGEALTGPAGMGSVRALSEYEGVEYDRTNRFLRGSYKNANGTEDFLAGTPERIAEIDKTMAVSKLTSDVKVDRVIRHGADVFGKDAWYGDVVDLNEKDFEIQDRQFERWLAGDRPDLTGLQWTDKGYVSTTADPNVAENFGSRWREFNSDFEGEPVVMSIHVPKGTGGVQLAEMGHAAEILLERGLTFELIQDDGVVDGYRRIVVRVVRT